MSTQHPRHVVPLLAGLVVLSSGAALAVRQYSFAPGLAAALCFGAVIAAALLISWGAEAAQFYVSQGFAVAFIALLQVVPEFMVEAVIAWEAGKTGSVDLVFANATGSNRLLTGFGWPLIFFVTDYYHRRRHGRPLDAIRLRSEHSVEILALLFASSWYLVILARGRLTLLDSAVLGGAFVFYLWVLNRLPAEEADGKEELLATPRYLVELRPALVRNVLLLALFALGGAVMWGVAHPFLDAMEHVAIAMGVSQFAFVQWVAPFLTEFPEKVTAVYWSRTVKLAPMALLNMVSSTVNQYTLLVAMIPIVYSLSVGAALAHLPRPAPPDRDLPLLRHHPLRRRLPAQVPRHPGQRDRHARALRAPVLLQRPHRPPAHRDGGRVRAAGHRVPSGGRLGVRLPVRGGGEPARARDPDPGGAARDLRRHAAEARCSLRRSAINGC